MKRSHLLCLFLAGALPGCGELPEDETVVSSAEGLEAGCTAVSPDLVAHACVHVTDGSSMSVNASATLAFTSSTPNVNVVHTYYTVNIPGSGSSRQGAVKYVPSSTGDWVVLQNGNVPFTVVRHSTGATISPVLEHDVSTCTGLTRVRVFPLTKGVTYRLVFGTTSSATTQIVLERLGEFTSFFYADVDEDGYGDANDEVVTTCLPPEGYTLDSSDCDDADPDVHPGVPDDPGGADLDCNGIP